MTCDKFSTLTEKEIIKLTRHKAELPLRVIAVVITLLVFAVIGACGILAMTNEEALFFLCDLFSINRDNASIVKQVSSWLFVIEIVYILISLLVIVFRIYKNDMAKCIRVTENNFPGIYRKLHQYCERLGIEEVPGLYIVDAVDEKITDRVPCNSYIRISRHDYEIAKDNNHPDTLYFTLAQCVGHIYLNQSTIIYQLCSCFANLIPVFSHAVSRSMYYSADRVAQVLTSGSGETEFPHHAICGKMSAYADERYVKDMMKIMHSSFGERFCCFLSSLFSYKPFAIYRLYAYTDPERKSGKLF